MSLQTGRAWLTPDAQEVVLSGWVNDSNKICVENNSDIMQY